ncbi:MAG: hypothetical protein RL632_1156 [Bacteroidota bacterium]|jgi:hypothetical protein
MHKSFKHILKGPSKVGLFLFRQRNVLLFLVLFPLLLSTFGLNDSGQANKQKIRIAQASNRSKVIRYKRYQPKSITDFTLQDFQVEQAYRLGEYKVVNVYRWNELNEESTSNDWGDRLLLLNAQNEIVFTSVASGDLYLYQPYFFKSNHSSKIIVVCQMGFEYYCGGDVFIIENGQMTAAGYLNIEGIDEDKPLVDILAIHESEDKLTFTFRADSLIIDPGGETEHITNSAGIRYEYERGELMLRGDGL